MNKRSFKYAWVSGQLLAADSAVIMLHRWSSTQPALLTHSSACCRHPVQLPCLLLPLNSGCTDPQAADNPFQLL